MQAVYYRAPDKSEPVDDFINGLPEKRAAKIDSFVEEHLNGLAPGAPPPKYPITSQIAGELRELRIRFANIRYRVLFQRSGNLFVLLHAIEKNTGSVPQSDIDAAMARMKDFKARMDAQPRKAPRAIGQDAPAESRRRVERRYLNG